MGWDWGRKTRDRQQQLQLGYLIQFDGGLSKKTYEIYRLIKKHLLEIVDKKQINKAEQV